MSAAEAAENEVHAIEKPSTELSLRERALAAIKLEVTVAQLTELAASTATIMGITNPDGRKQVHAAAMFLADQRIYIDKAGKDARDDAKKFAKQCIAEARQLIGIIQPEEKRLLTLRDAWDEARAAEKKAKVEAETKRVAAIHNRIAELHGNQLLTPAIGSGLIAQHIDELQRIAVDDSFAEFRGLADTTKSASLERMGKLLAAALTHEAEQQRLTEERAELARQRAAQEEANRKERERIAAEEAAARAKREAEEAEAKRIRDAAAAERKRLADEQEARLRAEREEAERVAAQQRAQREQEDAERRERQRIEDEQRHAAERVRLEAEQEKLRLLREQQEAESAAAQAEQDRIAAENARQAEELSRQQAELDRQRQEQEAAQLELERRQKPVATTSVTITTQIDPPAVDEPGVIELSPRPDATIEAVAFQPSVDDLIDLVAAEYGVRHDTAAMWLRDAFAPVPAA